MIKKVAILTSGGDSPGMNAAIRSISKHAKANGIIPYFVFEGYKGLYEGNMVEYSELNFDSLINLGGTKIYSSRFPEFKNPSIREEAKKQLLKREIDALVVIGGDGSYKGAQLLHEIGIKTIVLPGTIDNDITSSDYTIGFFTALETIVKSINQIRDTMESHNRAAIVEVMGHGCGDLALFAGIATGAELIVTNECKKTVDEISQVIKNQVHDKKKRSAIVIVSELIYDDLKKLQDEVSEKSQVVTRCTSLGHTQRGGNPSSIEIVSATMMGIHSIDLLLKNESGLAVGIKNGKINQTPILEALSMEREKREKWINKINKLNQT